MSRGRGIGAAILAALAAWCAVVMADFAALTVLGEGPLTGPLSGLAYAGALALLVAAALFAFRLRFARGATIAGGVLSLPWALWLLFPGLACRFAPCPGDYPAAVFNPIALGMIVLPLAALAAAGPKGRR